jgi:hypothetical protein
MRHDPFEALERHYAGQSFGPSSAFQERIESALRAEMEPINLEPAIAGLRRGVPIAATILLGVLTPRFTASDVRALADKVERAQAASSVQTELETPWEN